MLCLTLWKHAIKAVEQVIYLKSQLGLNQKLNPVELPNEISDFISDSGNIPYADQVKLLRSFFRQARTTDEEFTCNSLLGLIFSIGLSFKTRVTCLSRATGQKISESPALQLWSNLPDLLEA